MIDISTMSDEGTERTKRINIEKDVKEYETIFDLVIKATENSWRIRLLERLSELPDEKRASIWNNGNNVWGLTVKEMSKIL